MQNRVDPFGNIIATAARGLWMGNRGKIHNDKQAITHAFKLKAWLICKLEFNGRKRQVMGLNTYTELFFLDEATAFAAGHRPCFECRRKDFTYFKMLWLKANPGYKLTPNTSIQKIDEVLQAERMHTNGSKKTYVKNINSLPDGSFVSIDNNAYLLAGKQMHLWSPYGYKKHLPFLLNKKVDVLTPRSSCKHISGGLHTSNGFIVNKKL